MTSEWTMNKLDKNQIAQYIDHTLLKPDSQSQDIRRLCQEAMMYSFYSVCVNSSWVPLCSKLLKGSSVKISAVCGFPLGAAASESKAFEAANAVESGAAEIDMVLPIGQLKEGNKDSVFQDIYGVVQAVKGKAVVKVILETCLLTMEQKNVGCRLAEQAGAHFVKTSTGFSSGGATIEDVRLMKRAVSSHIGVKASGGIRDLAAAIHMLEAGATRLGTSAGADIVNGLSGTEKY